MEGKLKKSRYLHRLANKNGIVYYHSLFGNARLLDSSSEILLEHFDGNNTLEEIYSELRVCEDETEIVNEIVEDFISTNYIVDILQDERKKIKEDNEKYMMGIDVDFPFEFIGFSITKKCNFSCKYCIAGSNVADFESLDFDRDKMVFYISKFADELIFFKKEKLSIGFTGGEPLIFWKDLKYVLDKIYERYSNKLVIDISINTNLSLMTPEIAKYFKLRDIHPFTSLDGTQEWNNKVRTYKNGRGTFNDIIRGINYLKDQGIICKSFYLTLTENNFDFEEDKLLQFADEHGFESITIEPDLIEVLNLDVDLICSKLFSVYQKAQKYNIDINGFWKRPYNNLFSYEESRSGFCRALDFKSIVVDRDGFLSPCGYSKIKLSKIENFYDLKYNEQYVSFIKSNLRGNILQCKDCQIEGVCKGGCLISREDTEKKNVFDYRCLLYKKMTHLLLEHSDFVEV